MDRAQAKRHREHSDEHLETDETGRRLEELARASGLLHEPEEIPPYISKLVQEEGEQAAKSLLIEALDRIAAGAMTPELRQEQREFMVLTLDAIEKIADKLELLADVLVCVTAPQSEASIATTEVSRQK